MKRLSRLVLSLGLLGLPWVIACAYGTYYKYSKAGRVIDRDTHAGVAGIEVECLVGGKVQSSSVSGPDGDVQLRYDEPCETLRATDSDGSQNGLYAETTMPHVEASATFTVLVGKAE